MSARVLAPLALLAFALPAGAQAAMPASLTAHTLRCRQTYASYAPNGRLDHYGVSDAWTVGLSNNGPHYDEVYGIGIPEKGAHAGPMTYAKGRLTFTDGPFDSRESGWRLVGRFVKGGAKMPHDPKPSRRYPLVLRSRTRHHSSDAPPRHQRSGRSWFYCR
jgi:hypothetical protein